MAFQRRRKAWRPSLASRFSSEMRSVNHDGNWVCPRDNSPQKPECAKEPFRTSEVPAQLDSIPCFMRSAH